MTGYTRTDTTNNIADGNIINAADFDNEFDAIDAAFNSATGHIHDGTANNGAPITKIGPTQDVIASATILRPKTTATVDLGTSALKFKDFYFSGDGSLAGTLTVGVFSNTGDTTLGDASTDTVRVNGYMGVGGAAASTTGVKISSSALTGVSQIGFQSAPVGTSAATTQVQGVGSQPGTAAAAFTCAATYAFRANNAVLGSGSTITDQHGVYVDDQTNGTNNYGIRSTVSSGANKWNIYASGTADNYFAGDVGIGTAAPVGKLDVFGASGGGAGTVVPVSITVGDTSTGNAWPGDGTLSTVFNYYSGDGTNTGVRWRHGVGETITSGQYSAWKLQYRSAGGAINDYTGFSDAISVDFNGNTTLGGYMGVGGAPYSGIAVYAQNTALLQTSQVGFQSSITGSSAGTNSLYGLLVANSTAAAAYTITNSYGARVNNVSLGAGSAITSQHGFYIADLTSGTNNYGITSAVSSGANKWNIYASGTAQNYFAGNVGINTNAPGAKLDVSGTTTTAIIRITQTTSASDTYSQLEFYDSPLASTQSYIRTVREGSTIRSALAFATKDASTLSERLRIDSSGNVGIGNTPSGTYKLEVTGKSYASGGIVTRTVAYANATSITFDVDTTDTATQANTQAVGTLTINAPTGTPYNGQKLIFRLQSTNVQTFSWNAIFAGSTDLVLPTASTGSSKYDYVGFIYNSTAAKWQLVAKMLGF